ncbi:hypothetical protein MMC13_003286 [Lambiella insularis]|nr:hypothetical protein [Lambiella insularis]
MSFMLTQTPDPLTLKEALPDFSRTSHIFLPINDCRNPAIAEGGSHWSLLLVSVVDGAAFHYDSMWPSNESSAALAAEKMSKLLGKRLVLKDLEDAPQQENSSDCGVFVCVLMRHLLLAKLLKAARGERVGMSMGDKAVDAHRARKEILSIIENFRREGEKRRRQVFFPALGLVFASMPSNRTSASREPMLMFITAEAQVHMGIPRPTRKVEVRHGLTEALRISMTTEHDQ